MILTKHSIEQAKKRGISREAVNLALKLGSRYYCSEVAKGNYSKRIFFEINLLIAKHDRKVTDLEYQLLNNLCLVVNEEEQVLITIYRKGELN